MLLMSTATERMRAVFRKTERALLKLSSSHSPETVHGFRTASRRLQTLIEEFVPQRDRSQKKLLKMLDRIRRRAGKVRDIDVQLAALRSLKIPQEPRRKTQFIQNLIELRVRHEKRLRKLLTKEAIREIRKRLKRASQEASGKAGRLDTNRDPLTVARHILERVPRSEGPLTQETLHHYRVAIKRARYAAEFAAKSTEAAQFVAALTRVQDAVGTWHDWHNLTQTAARRLGEVNESPLVAALHNVTGGKFRHAVTALSNSPAVRTAARNISPAAEPSRKAGTNPPPVARTDSAA